MSSDNITVTLLSPGWVIGILRQIIVLSLTEYMCQSVDPDVSLGAVTDWLQFTLMYSTCFYTTG